MIKNAGKVKLCLFLEMNIKVNLKITNLMDLEDINGKMEKNILEII